MDSGRRSFFGTLLSLMATPFIMGGCQIPRKRRGVRPLAGHLDIVSTQYAEGYARCVTVTADEKSLRFFAEGIGKTLYRYAPCLPSRMPSRNIMFGVPGDGSLVHCTFFIFGTGPHYTTEEEIGKSIYRCIKAGYSVMYVRRAAGASA